MLKKLLITLVFISGCQTMTDVGTSKELFVGCRAADVATSWWAIAHGAYEVGSFSLLPLVLINIGASILAWHSWEEMDTGGKAFVNIISCAPVINNVSVIRSGS